MFVSRLTLWVVLSIAFSFYFDVMFCLCVFVAFVLMCVFGGLCVSLFRCLFCFVVFVLCLFVFMFVLVSVCFGFVCVVRRCFCLSFMY